MKRVMIIPEGVADAPVAALRERTPLAAARTPTLDTLAQRGRLGVANYAAPRETARPHLTLLSALGYDPREYPVGRAWLQASAVGVDFPPEAQPLMADFVTIADERVREIVRDLRPAELFALVAVLNEVGAELNVRFHELADRVVAVGAGLDAARLRAMPPEEALDQRVRRCEPRGAGSRVLRDLTQKAAAVLEPHDVNAVRRDLGENPADRLWLWGAGPAPKLPAFADRWGRPAIGVASSPLARGAFRAAGCASRCPPGDGYAPLAQAALSAIDAAEVVIVYVDDALSATLRGDVFGKVGAIEALDRELIAPMLKRLSSEPAWRLLIAPTIAAEVELRCYSSELSLVCLAGHDIDSARGAAFDEDHAEVGELDIERGWELMEYFLLR